MNIFFLHEDVEICAQMHLDKHVVKMILETSQLLSTAHRVLDGQEIIRLSKSGRKQKAWQLPDARESILYSATHVNHPSAIWCRRSKENYLWLARLNQELCREYTYRYGKTHSCERSGLMEFLLNNFPDKFPFVGFTPVTPAMPDQYKVPSSVESYRNYYNGAKSHIARWKNRPIPTWFQQT